MTSPPIAVIPLHHKLQSSPLGIILHILLHHRARLNLGPAINRHSRINDGASPNMDILGDGDRLPDPAGCTPRPLAHARVRHGGQDLHVLPDPGLGADGDGARVDDGAVLADEDVLADPDVVAVLTLEGGLDDAAGPDGAHRVPFEGVGHVGERVAGGGEDFAQFARALRLGHAHGGIVGVVELFEGDFAAFAVFDEEGVGVFEELAIEHFFSLELIAFHHGALGFFHAEAFPCHALEAARIDRPRGVAVAIFGAMGGPGARRLLGGALGTWVLSHRRDRVGLLVGLPSELRDGRQIWTCLIREVGGIASPSLRIRASISARPGGAGTGHIVCVGLTLFHHDRSHLMATLVGSGFSLGTGRVTFGGVGVI
jgi:hypothetical protein